MNCPSRTEENPLHPEWNQNPPFLPPDLTTREDLNGIVNSRHCRSEGDPLASDCPRMLDRIVESDSEIPPSSPPSRIAEAKLPLYYRDGRLSSYTIRCRVGLTKTDKHDFYSDRSLLCESASFNYFPNLDFFDRRRLSSAVLGSALVLVRSYSFFP